MTGDEAKAAIFSKENIQCNKAEYEREVRTAIEDTILRSHDVGDEKQERFAKAELRRLDREFEFNAIS